MNLFETAWLTVITIIVTYIAYKLFRFQQINNRIYEAAERTFSEMGTRSGQVRKAKATQRIRKESKGKLIDAIADEIPYASAIIGNLVEKQGMKENELWAMATDPDIINGVVVLAKGAKSVTEAIGGVFGGDREKKQRQPRTQRRKRPDTWRLPYMQYE